METSHSCTTQHFHPSPRTCFTTQIFFRLNNLLFSSILNNFKLIYIFKEYDFEKIIYNKFLQMSLYIVNLKLKKKLILFFFCIFKKFLKRNSRSYCKINILKNFVHYYYVLPLSIFID